MLKPVVAFFACSILGCILWFQPHYGLMDDATLLHNTLAEIESNGLFSYSWNHAIHSDSKWGMFRLTYMPMTYSIYSVGSAFDSTAMFLWNALIVMALFYLSATCLGRSIKINRWEILVGMASFPYAYDLFQHPSLQEKMLLLFGMPLLAVPYLQKPLSVRLIAYLTLLLLGFASKASFCIFAGVGLIAWIDATKNLPKSKAWLSSLIILFATFTCTLGLILLAKNGSYTSNHYNLSKIPGNLTSKYGLVLIALVLTYFAFYLRPTIIRTNLSVFIAPLGILAYLAIFSAWNLGGYLLSILTPFWAAILVQIAKKIFSERMRHVWLLPLVLLALTVSSYRPISMFSRLGDLNTILHTIGPKLISDQLPLYVPCHEGSDAIRLYINAYNLSAEIQVYHLNSGTRLSDGYVIFDKSMCPISPVSAKIDHCRKTSVYQPFLKGGYQVQALECE